MHHPRRAAPPELDERKANFSTVHARPSLPASRTRPKSITHGPIGAEEYVAWLEVAAQQARRMYVVQSFGEHYAERGGHCGGERAAPTWTSSPTSPSCCSERRTSSPSSGRTPPHSHTRRSSCVQISVLVTAKAWTRDHNGRCFTCRVRARVPPEPGRPRAGDHPLSLRRLDREADRPRARHREPDVPRGHGQLHAERTRRLRAVEHPSQPLPWRDRHPRTSCQPRAVRQSGYRGGGRHSSDGQVLRRG